MATITFKELHKKIGEYENIFHNLRKAIIDEYSAFFMYSAGIVSCKNENLKSEFFEHAQEEHEHALLFSDILKDLSGTGFVIDNLEMFKYSGDCPYKAPYGDSRKLVKDNINAENCAIESYTRLLESFKWSPEHKRIIEGIIRDEEEHVEDLKKMEEKLKKEFEEYIKKIKEADSSIVF